MRKWYLTLYGCIVVGSNPILTTKLLKKGGIWTLYFGNVIVLWRKGLDYH